MQRGKRLEVRFATSVANSIPIEFASEREDRQGIDFFLHPSPSKQVAMQLTFFPSFAFDLKKSANSALRKGVPLVYVKLERPRAIPNAARLVARYVNALSPSECLLIIERGGRILHKILSLHDVLSLDLIPDRYRYK